MRSPQIHFCAVTFSRKLHYIRSSQAAIRFRVQSQRGTVVFDADWFTTGWKLAPAARDTIFAHCNRTGALDWGGGAACLIIRVKAPHAPDFQQFLKRVVEDPTAWLRWSHEKQEFLPLPITEAAA